MHPKILYIQVKVHGHGFWYMLPFSFQIYFYAFEVFRTAKLDDILIPYVALGVGTSEFISVILCVSETCSNLWEQLQWLPQMVPLDEEGSKVLLTYCPSLLLPASPLLPWLPTWRPQVRFAVEIFAFVSLMIILFGSNRVIWLNILDEGFCCGEAMQWWLWLWPSL